MKQAALLLLTGCTIAACNRAPKETPTIKVPYNGSYEITMHEWRAMKKLSFDIKTTEVLNCANYYISPGSTTSDPGTVSLSLQGLSIRGGCEPGMDNAGRSQEYELVNGTYPLVITNNNISSGGTIVVTDSMFFVTFDESNKVHFTSKVLRRLPKNTIHGVIYTFNTTVFVQAQSVIDSMIYYGAQPFIGDTGVYDRITVVPGNTFTKEDDKNRSEHYRNFIYTYTGNVDDLKKLAGRYNKRTNGELSIFIETPDGELINSYATD